MVALCVDIVVLPELDDCLRTIAVIEVSVVVGINTDVDAVLVAVRVPATDNDVTIDDIDITLFGVPIAITSDDE